MTGSSMAENPAPLHDLHMNEKKVEGAGGRHPLSVIILTYNEEANLPDCIESLKGLDCELFVVDSGSTDATRSIALSGGAKIFEHPFDNYSVQRNWALRCLPIQSAWVLNLDADERLTPELVTEINETISRARADTDGYLLRKRTTFMGRWIKHGGHYPSYHLRLFRHGRGRCEDRLYDQHFLVDGEIETLKHDYLDVLTPDISIWTLRHTRWAEAEAKQMIAGGTAERRVRPDFLGNPIERRRWLRDGPYRSAPPFLRAFLYWFYRYFLRLGFLDGREGLIFHFLQGCWFRFLVDAKIYEFERRREIHKDETLR
ncbi:MAG TPA: glycosyltransferase family 2 protein [Pyrinomonadaceae bacterium]|jgi:glycosyltransferase involved in cell wall biosynthesis|nr:glycosyltransferase family 2 protein [Pyrinomonadaceae bacterium]